MKKGYTNSRNSGPAILAAMPGTRAQLEQRTGLTVVQKHVALLRKAGQAHIGGWERAPEGEYGCKWIPVYHAGPGIDVRCRFKKKTRKQINDAFARRVKESGQLDALNARKRAQYWARKAQKQRDPLVAALFGAPVKRP